MNTHSNNAMMALRDLLDQLEGLGIAIPGEDEGQWAGTEGLSFSLAYSVISAYNGPQEA